MGVILPYNCKLYVVPQADRYSIALLHSNVLEPTRQRIAPLIELSICQALSLVS